MKNEWIYISIIFIGSAVFSCNNDDEGTAPPINNPAPEGKDWVYQPTEVELEIPAYFPEIANNKIIEEKFQLGRHLFYENRLSRNNTISCGSCHHQNKAFTDGRQFSLGLNAEPTPRNAMSVVNMLWEDLFFWDARAKTLEEQALMPIQDHIEMDLTLAEAVDRLDKLELYDSLFFHAYGDTLITPERIAIAISEFEKGIISKDSKFDKFKRGEESLTSEEQLGSKLFSTHPGPKWNQDFQLYIFERGGNCGDCHTSVNFNKFVGAQGMQNNGLESDDTRVDDGYFKVTNNPNDKGKFKTPSLRNVELTAPYMHDGRFNTLEEVLEHYNEHVQVSNTLSTLMYVNNDPDQQGIISPDGKTIQLGLTESEKSAIIAFLKTLTDNELINDPRFTNPFLEE
ncbi:cytochrome-c peroxidase [Hyphobacterium sp. CCMP332]|nr:cytochrome-c peroxidase [Hyphobacterium sp. CCMP332]